jgi:hypothetical protein
MRLQHKINLVWKIQYGRTPDQYIYANRSDIVPGLLMLLCHFGIFECYVKRLLFNKLMTLPLKDNKQCRHY